MRTAESEPGRRIMVEPRPSPRHVGVASLASRRKSRRGMVRIGGRLERLHVAGRTLRGYACVLPTAMTLRARLLSMRSCESEPGSIVIELRTAPLLRLVACVARGRETGCRVFGTRGPRVILHVATFTRTRRALENIADVTLATRRARMRPRQRELRRSVVIEAGAAPLLVRVTHIAGCRKTGRGMIRARRARVIGHVATFTRTRCALEDIADVTLAARRVDVRPRQRELRRSVVIEAGAAPLLCRMTSGAVARKAGGPMVRITRRIERRAMATEAVRAGACVASTVVALRTTRRRVRSSEREPAQVVVVFGARPQTGCVASFALRRKVSPPMIGIDCLLEILSVTADAVLRRPRETPGNVT